MLLNARVTVTNYEWYYDYGYGDVKGVVNDETGETACLKSAVAFCETDRTEEPIRINQVTDVLLF